MRFQYSKELYPKTALLKAAYHFTDIAYLHLDADDEYYIVDIKAKDGKELDEKTFENEILSQAVRYAIFQQTKEIREISLARALASSVVEKDIKDEHDSEEKSIVAGGILKDWFHKR